jgi:phage terminase large subunit
MTLFLRDRFDKIPRRTVAADYPPYWSKFAQPAPYKILYGGRGGAKSWSVARSYVLEASRNKYRYLCTREFQSSMKDSVYKLLVDQIYALELDSFFDIQEATIKTLSGSEFLFKGLKRDPNSVRSTEKIDRCWVEEAHAVSYDSWNILMPTLFRTPDCELTVTFNPYLEDDPTFVTFVKNPPPGAVIEKVGWRDNPWFPEKHNELRLHMLRTDPDAYDWIWEGNTRQLSDAVVFRNRVSVDDFESPPMDKTRYYFGVDFGFANDPTVMLRCFIHEDVLFVDYEAYGYRVELNDLPEMFEQVPGSKQWPSFADSARPETISYLNNHGYPHMEAVDKWNGSVEDGIARLKAFERIVIHPRCPNFAQEMRLYSYKTAPHRTDPAKARVLPIIVDRHNNGPDACRYAINELVRGGAGYFEVSDAVLAWASQRDRR